MDDGNFLWFFFHIRNSWTPVVDSFNISSKLILEMLDRSWEIYSFKLFFFYSKILERMLRSLDSAVGRFNLMASRNCNHVLHIVHSTLLHRRRRRTFDFLVVHRLIIVFGFRHAFHRIRDYNRLTSSRSQHEIADKMWKWRRNRHRCLDAKDHKIKICASIIASFHLMYAVCERSTCTAMWRACVFIIFV